jgi:cell wall-associated NlpC family hydrolase
VVAEHQRALEALDRKREAVEAAQEKQKDEIDELSREYQRAVIAERRAERRAEKRQQTATTDITFHAQSPGAEGAVEAALSRVGSPYVWGAAGPSSFDCSGLTMWAWARGGVSLPHSSQAQYDVLRHVSRADIQPGDLTFYGSPIHHVGIYIGGGQMINAPHTGDVVRIADAFRGDYVGAARP